MNNTYRDIDSKQQNSIYLYKHKNTKTQTRHNFILIDIWIKQRKWKKKRIHISKHKKYNKYNTQQNTL